MTTTGANKSYLIGDPTHAEHFIGGTCVDAGSHLLQYGIINSKTTPQGLAYFDPSAERGEFQAHPDL